MRILTGEIVEILPTAIWIENGFCGERCVMVQHQGMQPFEYARFNYDYCYTDNAGTHRQATRLAIELGSSEPVEHRHRSFEMPTAEATREQIKALQAMLDKLEPPPPPKPLESEL